MHLEGTCLSYQNKLHFLHKIKQFAEISKHLTYETFRKVSLAELNPVYIFASVLSDKNNNPEKWTRTFLP